jgi:carboxylate-amine ligase
VLFQALCLYAQSTRASWLYPQILAQNRWNAIRHGLEGVYQNKQEVAVLRNHAKALILRMDDMGVFEQLGTEEYVKKLLLLLEHPTPAHFQKECFETHRCLSEVERLGILT